MAGRFHSITLSLGHFLLDIFRPRVKHPYENICRNACGKKKLTPKED